MTFQISIIYILIFISFFLQIFIEFGKKMKRGLPKIVFASGDTLTLPNPTSVTMSGTTTMM